MCYRYMQRQASMRKESDETAPVETRQDERMPTRETTQTAFTRFMAEMKRWMAQRERETTGS
jgi:hypothetical protein